MWEHDHLIHYSLIPQMNSIREILEARNAAIQADSSQAVRAFLNPNLQDLGKEHFPIGPSVQIAADQQWGGAFRFIAHSAGNFPIERGNKILKWPKCKTRLVNIHWESR